MLPSLRVSPRLAVAVLAAIGFLAAPQDASAFSILTGCNGCFGGCGLNIGNNIGQNIGQNIGGAGGGAGGGANLLTRTMNNLPTVTNYWQYSQVTGVKPIIGTVTIYNTFGTLSIQGGGGLGQGFQAGSQASGGLGLGNIGQAGSGNIPGLGASRGGDDAPAGVLLHVQYAQMFLPNQNQINQNAFQVPGGGLGGLGGLGGFPGFGGGGVKGFGQINGFGNGGSGL